MQWVLRGFKVSDWGSYHGWVKLGRVVTTGTCMGKTWKGSDYWDLGKTWKGSDCWDLGKT